MLGTFFHQCDVDPVGCRFHCANESDEFVRRVFDAFDTMVAGLLEHRYQGSKAILRYE